MQSTPDPEWMTIDEVASLLGFRNTSSVRSLVSRGELAVAARGSRYRAYFDRSAVLALMRERAAFYGRQRSGNGVKNGQEEGPEDDGSRHHRVGERELSSASACDRSEDGQDGRARSRHPRRESETGDERESGPDRGDPQRNGGRQTADAPRLRDIVATWAVE